ncbi:MAG: ribulose-phosphate 3-epimerase [Candidatus Eisenbacteria bacterium]
MRKPRSIPGGIQVAPSLLAADFARLAEEIETIEAAGVEVLHLDVMDGHFVPNITFGPPLVRSVRRTTGMFLDTHLMIRDPLAFLEPFVTSGADLLTLHAESLGDPAGEWSSAIVRAREAKRRLDDLGCRMGISFRPATDPGPWLKELGAQLDLVLIMTVEPGFGGQGFLEQQLLRIAGARELREDRHFPYRIEVDGGITAETARACVRAGADILVAGTAIFGRQERGEAVREILAAARS